MKFGKSKKQPSCTVLLIVAIAAWVLYGATSWWAGGTTLIELLVVIGMISIFASMLGSSIAGAHRHARGEPQQSSPPPEAKPVEPVAEAAKPEPTGVKAPDISIHEAAEDGNIEAVKQHLTDGVGVNAKSEMGRTTLHSAAREGHKEVIELLIAKGADVNVKDDDGTTPLDMADDKETADFLRKHGGKTGEELKAEGK